MKTDKKSFNAGFDAGYALGQHHAGEGGYWLTPPTRDVAWKEFISPKKKKLVEKVNPIDEDDDVELGDEEIPY